LVRKNFALARRSALALLVGFPVAMGVTMLATLVWEKLGWLTLGNLDGIRNVEFIYEVGPFSLVVALLAGAAGMLSLVSSKSAALVGVFISVTTIPAAGNAAVAAVLTDWYEAGQSLLQLGVNLVGIVAAGALTLWIRSSVVSRRPARGA
jgi:uncharacterized hydrophobic protein (TIGR00271 family)